MRYCLVADHIDSGCIRFQVSLENAEAVVEIIQDDSMNARILANKIGELGFQTRLPGDNPTETALIMIEGQITPPTSPQPLSILSPTSLQPLSNLSPTSLQPLSYLSNLSPNLSPTSLQPLSNLSSLSYPIGLQPLTQPYFFIHVTGAKKLL